MDPLPDLPALASLPSRLSRGESSVPDLLRGSLARIDRLDGRWRALSWRLPPERLLLQARALQEEARDGRARGALHGALVTVKGSIPVAGMPWTEGSALFSGRVAAHDAEVVSRVREAGGLVIGGTTLSELAMYGVTNPFEPMGLNPWAAARTAGGSSTGAGVAAALGYAHVHLGTDSGGSVRNPACHCGVVGFMPRIGALSLAGKANYTPSLTSVGLIAARVADIAVAWRALRDAAGPPGAAAGIRRLLVPGRLVRAMCDAQTLALFEQGCRRLSEAGVDLVEGEVDGWLEGERAAGVVSLAESGAALAAMDLTGASEGLRARAAAAARLAPGTVTEARVAMASLREALARTLAATGACAVATPTWPFAAPAIDAVEVEVAGRRVPVDPHRNAFVRAANAVDACAVSLPMGLYPEEVPAGLHLMAPGGSEDALLSIAESVEACLPPLPPAPPLRGAA